MAKITLHKNNVEKVLARTPSTIQDFPEERLADLDLMLFEGKKGVHAIATIIQKEWGFYKDKTTKTIARHVQAYKESALGQSRMEELAAQEEKVLEQRFDRRVDVMKELEDLFLLQKERVTKLYTKEKDMPGGLSLKQLDALARDMASTGAALAKLQMATGVIAKAPTKITGTVMDDTGTERPFSWTSATAALYEEVTRLNGTDDK